ncbi:MAG: FeoA family protein [Deltaproteobacteria bacterium]
MHRMTLNKVKKDHKVTILEVAAGRMANARLSSLGLRPGVMVTKISSFALRGPVAVRVGRSTVAIGHGMAEKIIVESSRPAAS